MVAFLWIGPGTVTALAEPGLTGRVSNADASWESSVRWTVEGIQGSEYGAFAEQMPVTGSVLDVQVDLTRTDFPGPAFLSIDAYVWDDADGQPGPVLSVVPFDFEGEIPLFPETTPVLIPIVAPRTQNPWVGVRILPELSEDLVGIAADLDGGAYVAPMTNIAPGLGLPEGWQPMETTFEPTASLGISATMDDIAFEGDILESAGGSADAPVARYGEWDFERFSEEELDEADAPGCDYDWPDAVGSIVDFSGWVAAGPDLGAGVQPFLLEDGTLATGTESDVEGYALSFYDPDVLGFPPHHRVMYELPTIDDEALGLSPGFSALHFVADTDFDAPPETELLQWIVGSSVLRADGTWSPWQDLTFPVTLGPSNHLIPVLAQGSVRRIRIGMTNPGDIQVFGRGKRADRAKEKKKTFGPQEGYKAVPVINQSKAEVTCQSAAAAQCLAYWAANGYPEILPEDGTLKNKQKELAKELAKEIERSTEEGDGKKGKGWGGIESFLKKKGLHSPQVPPGGPPPRRSLQSEDIPTTKGDPYGEIKDNLSRSHDVILGITAYRDSAGVQVAARNKQGRPIAHAVTAAQVVEENGKKTIRAADPNGSSTAEVEDIEKAGKTYQDFEVTDTGPPVQLKTKKKLWPTAEYYCLTSIQIVRPDPANEPDSRPAPAVTADFRRSEGGHGLSRGGSFNDGGSTSRGGFSSARSTVSHGGFSSARSTVSRGGSFSARSSMSRGGSLVSYGYAIENDRTSPMSYFVLQIEVPFTEVESPPGWQWDSLPSIPPDYESCVDALGKDGKGIVWWTNTNPIEPDEQLGGFGFKASSEYPSDPEALDWYVATHDHGGQYGFVGGPGIDDPANAPDPTETSSADRTLVSVAFPNPASSEVRIRFEAPEAGNATLSIFDATGRLVSREENVRVPAGTAQLQWNRRDRAARTLGSGVYLYRVELGERKVEGRIVILE